MITDLLSWTEPPTSSAGLFNLPEPKGFNVTSLHKCHKFHQAHRQADGNQSEIIDEDANQHLSEFQNGDEKSKGEKS